MNTARQIAHRQVQPSSRYLARCFSSQKWVAKHQAQHVGPIVTMLWHIAGSPSQSSSQGRRSGGHLIGRVLSQQDSTFASLVNDHTHTSLCTVKTSRFIFHFQKRKETICSHFFSQTLHCSVRCCYSSAQLGSVMHHDSNVPLQFCLRH